MTTAVNHSFGKVAVLMGGDSAEREISLQSGAFVLEALQAACVDAIAIDTQNRQQLFAHLQSSKIDRVFNALHGRGGEDGVVQGFLSMLGIPYTGSGVLGSALSMDKYKTKQVWMASGLPTPDCVLVEDKNDLQVVRETIGFPCVMKPVHEGSSIGVSLVRSEDELLAAWTLANDYDRLLLAEALVEGKEYTAGILDQQVLPLIRLETPNTFYDYEAKYQSEATQYHCPCGLADDVEEEMQALSLQAFNAVEAEGWGRVDFMLDKQGHPWLIEVNTVPGMTRHSLVPMAAKQAGIPMQELVMRILQSSLQA
ncbi:MAG: D-alanine--D-alanine ligase [Gammaproteobacteria bacterium]